VGLPIGCSVSWADVAVVAGLVVVWTLIADRVDRFGVTAPMLFAAVGLLISGDSDLHVSLSASTIRVAAEVTLVLVLFGDAARVRIHSLRQDVGLPVRLLAIGLPLTLVLGTFLAVALFGSFGIWMAVLTAACLAPTDAGLGQGIVTDPTVPSRVRRVENVESGLNDGIVAPLVSLAVAVLAGEETHGSDAVLHAIREIGLGVVIGVGGGLLLGWILALAVTHGWTEERAAALATTAGALGIYALAVAVHANGFVAAFLAGMSFGIFRHRVGTESLGHAEATGQLLSYLVWFVFGAAMLRPALSSPQLGRSLIYAVLSLTVVRMVPVALALFRARLGNTTVAFIGWFGPRGLASVIFALLAFDQLGREASTLMTTVSITVALSVVAHGLTAPPLISRYAAHAQAKPKAHSLLQEVEVPTARKALGSLAERGRRAA
jgi:sodium/hydrogen antiporter